MSIFRINPSALSGSITVPSSKSHTLRAIVFAMMANGKSIIHNYLPSPDTDTMLKAITCLGAEVTIHPRALEIKGVNGKLKCAENVIDAGNSGITFRFIAALAALLPTYTVITGDASIRHNRPIAPLLKGLESLGAFAVSTRMDGFAPIIVRGPMKGGIAHLAGEDSQPVSALLIAASFLEGSTDIFVENPGEKPWIDLTLDWLEKLGIHIENHQYEHYRVRGSAGYDGFERYIPGDFSSAAYPIAAALATNSELTLHNIDRSDIQGDQKFIDLAIQMGAKIDIDASTKSLRIQKGGVLKGIRIDGNDCIDMITILPVLACFAEGTTEIYNARIARSKESDRISAIIAELKKMGASIEEKEDGMIITPKPLFGAHLQSYADHRMTLALSVAALAAKGESMIEGAQAIDKTYPTFKQDFQALGACIL